VVRAAHLQQQQQQQHAFQQRHAVPLLAQNHGDATDLFVRLSPVTRAAAGRNTAASSSTRYRYSRTNRSVASPGFCARRGTAYMFTKSGRNHK